MNQLINGSTTLYLDEPDQGGNVGYSLAYQYTYNPEDILGTFLCVEINFSGPGSWEEYSCGDEYPIEKMMQQALSDQDTK